MKLILQWVFAYLRYVAAAFLLVAAQANAVEEMPEVEVLHWWASPGEVAALGVFVDAYKARNGRFIDSGASDQASNRESAIDRMSKGLPASLTQWNAGRDIREFYELGLINPVTDPELLQKLRTTLLPSVLDAVSHNDEIIAMPLNVHGENWMWYNPGNMQFQESMMSGDWRGLLEEGARLDEKKVPLLAVGNQPWQVRILFTSLFMGVSRDAYRSFYLDTDASIVDSEVFRDVLELFGGLARYSKSFGDGSWRNQIKAVAGNLAGASFMGDWAKGEFESLGMAPGEDFGCVLTPVDDPGLLMAIDTFILGKVTDASEKEGQALLLDIVAMPEISQQFSSRKGSISPFSGMESHDSDVCSLQAHSVLERNDAIMPPYATYERGDTIHAIDTEIYRFWTKSLESAPDPSLIDSSIDAFKSALVYKQLGIKTKKK